MNDYLRVVGPEPDWKQCVDCSEMVSWVYPPGRCETCHLKENERQFQEEWRARRTANIDSILQRCGMSTREALSVPDKITPEIAALLPKSLSGPRGFGLSGRPGIGKTGAIAAMFRERVIEGVKSALWLSWPETVNHWRITSMQNGGIGVVGEDVARAIDAEVLVLDDLGAERIKGNYLDDWAASQLDLVIDGRYRKNNRPTHFTTALSAEELGRLYGPRLYSRLCGENQLIVVPKLPDRRV